ncbi:MAG: cobalamin biosynthesis protein CobD [Opitutaceae bacterium]|nr:cobalamin biosynthesis protein CobD [Cytophagales bacterium]
MEKSLIFILPLLVGYVLDLCFGDPHSWPHPVKVFGNLISIGERLLNSGKLRFLKGMLLCLFLCILTFILFYFGMSYLFEKNIYFYFLLASVFVFFGLANKSLITEGRAVFDQLNSNGLDAGRKRLSWIVGRDTTGLSPQQIRISVFETMSENLSDGVIAPLFYYFIAGVPGIMTYKMINTLDSMIGYRNDRYEQFGKFSARLDDVANFVPARLTALLMVLVAWSGRGFQFIVRYGNKHKSPNSGYPEAALAGILNVRFGGPNVYHGKLVIKPYIGDNDRVVDHKEFQKVAILNNKVTFLMVLLLVCAHFLIY